MCMLLFVEKARQKCRAVRPRKVVVVRNMIFVFVCLFTLNRYTSIFTSLTIVNAI